MIALLALLLPYTLFFDVEPSSVVMHVATTEKMSAMCPLKIYKKECQKGILSLEIGRDLNGLCLMAFGPYRGTFFLELDEGDYDLWINDQYYGVLSYTQGEVLFLE